MYSYGLCPKGRELISCSECYDVLPRPPQDQHTHTPRYVLAKGSQGNYWQLPSAEESFLVQSQYLANVRMNGPDSLPKEEQP